MISNQFLEKPKDIESDILKACEEGKLTSVQWLFVIPYLISINNLYHDTLYHQQNILWMYYSGKIK